VTISAKNSPAGDSSDDSADSPEAFGGLTRAERDAVKAAGLSWWAYQSVMKGYAKPIGEEKLQRVPASLDLTPYRDEKDFSVLERLVKQKKSKR